MKRIFFGLLAAMLLVGSGAVGIFVWAEGAASATRPGREGSVEFTVPKGASGRSLGPLLQAADLLDDARIWRFHLWRRGGLALQAGRFSLSPAMSVAQLAAALEGRPLPEDEPFVMIEGWRLRDTDAAIVSAGLIAAGDYIAAAGDAAGYRAPFPLPKGSLEGYLYPETYAIVREGFDVRALVQRQIDTFARRFFEPHREAISASGRTLHELVVMASLLEREEPLPEQRPLVAGILWKRIDRGVPLGVDATSRYELAEWNNRSAFLKRLRDPNDPWNTRTRAGLPPGAIGAPTLESLLAAMKPIPSEYWYYLHDGDRILRPSRNAAEHEELRRIYNVY